MFSRRAIIDSIVVAGVLASSLAMSPRSWAQAGGVQQKLQAKYTLTKATDDKSDIVTAGAVVTLEKDKLLMYAVSTGAPPQNTYKDGRLSSGAFGAHEKAQAFGSFIGHPPPKTVTTRYYVTGEKFWVTRIDALSDGVVFYIFTDAVQDIRYYCTLKFIYPHGQTPSTDQVMSMVGEVLKVDQDNSQQGGDQQQAGGQDQGQQQGGGQDQGQQQGGQADNGQAQAAPPTIELGQTPDQVIGLIGQPEKKIELGGGKEIFVYKDIKVTFVGGKVVDVQ